MSQRSEYGRRKMSSWDNSSDQRFYKYYEHESLSEATQQRFKGISETLLRVVGNRDSGGRLDVVDVGCGAGTNCRLWAELGHRVVGVDVNAPLIELARARAAEFGLNATFRVGSATKLPLPDASADVCVVAELLEHVADWQACLRECARVLRLRGVLYVSTTNKLCPRQREFVLPVYSWYPGFLKRYCEALAMTRWPALAGYATYPAVNWFTYFHLRAFLSPLGFSCMDRFDLFDLMDKRDSRRVARLLCAMVNTVPGFRLIAHAATPYTLLVAMKGDVPLVVE